MLASDMDLLLIHVCAYNNILCTELEIWLYMYNYWLDFTTKNCYSSLTFWLTPELNWCSSTKGNSTKNWES